MYESDTLMDKCVEMATTIAGMNPNGVRMYLSHLDRTPDISRETSLERALEAPMKFDVDVKIDSKAEGVFASTRRDKTTL